MATEVVQMLDDGAQVSLELTIRPLADYVIVKRSLAEERKGMIFVPEVAKDLPNEGRALRVGPKVEGVKEGELVLFGKYSGIKLFNAGQEFLLLRENEILAVDDAPKGDDEEEGRENG